MKTKLCFYSIAAYSLFNRSNNAVFGGAEINLYNLAIELANNNNYEISFLVGDYEQQPLETYNKIKVRKLKYFNLEKYNKIHHKIFRQIMLWKELLFSDASIYITSSASEVLGWIVLIEKIIKKKKVIFRIAADVDVNLDFWKNMSFKMYFLYKLGIYNADIIVSQSEKQSSLLKAKLNLDSILIKNGLFIKEKQEVINKKIILWVSRADKEKKRPEKFVEIARQLPNEQFVIIMPGKKDDMNDILENISKQINITFIEYVHFFEVQRYYEEAKLFVNTSEYEGFPNSFIQACLAKTPILSFKVNPDNFINEYNLGCICDDNIDKAIEFIRMLNEEKVEYYGENAFSYAKKNHDIRESAKKYEKIITELMRG